MKRCVSPSKVVKSAQEPEKKGHEIEACVAPVIVRHHRFFAADRQESEFDSVSPIYRKEDIAIDPTFHLVSPSLRIFAFLFGSSSKKKERKMI